ncbi:glycosyltransferase [Shewanella amazonensis]|uniref:Glycosyl transferase, group 1 family protein n=1 Tax=Shewanella amazonensis (strain ATCC BAA-1098 / SB2B) TaxID=326297 RepID=A1S1R0_SHEAM|nr:glycosyltransferase [Shewanella amazonensis]ABL98316.1 glycosyl transferase, group 1 family protein [Shewanella amazonensis SB2B]
MTGRRIAIAIDSLAGGGAEKVMLTLASTLVELGHEPHLLVLQQDCHHEIPPGLQVHFCFGGDERNIDGFWRTRGSVQKLQQWITGLEERFGKFELFLSNLDKTNLLMTRTGVAPLYCVVHNSIEEELQRQRKLGPFAYLSMLRAKKSLNGQHLITVSKGIANEIAEVGRVQPASVQTIYNPFELEKIQHQASQTADALPKGDYIIHVGRFARQKRHDVLFAALKQMRNPLPLVLLCNNKKKAIKSARKFGVEDRVIIPGFQTNPYPWIKGARLLALSSDYEGLPTVLIESLAVGTPVVSTDCRHGPKEILTGALRRFLVPRRDPAALAMAMDEALTHYPDCDDAEILTQVGAAAVAGKYLKLLTA